MTSPIPPSNPFAPPPGLKPMDTTDQMTREELNRMRELDKPVQPKSTVTLGPAEKKANSLFEYYRKQGMLPNSKDQE